MFEQHLRRKFPVIEIQTHIILVDFFPVLLFYQRDTFLNVLSEYCNPEGIYFQPSGFYSTSCLESKRPSVAQHGGSYEAEVVASQQVLPYASVCLVVIRNSSITLPNTVLFPQSIHSRLTAQIADYSLQVLLSAFPFAHLGGWSTCQELYLQQLSDLRQRRK
jgi:hypothetical protein